MMNDNVIPFDAHKSDLSNDQVAEQKARETARKRAQKRFETATEVSEALRQKRTLPEDRPIFADNLWKLWREAQNKHGVSSLRKVFEEAFGVNFDAKYKKNFRLIREKGTKSELEYAANGIEYLALAKSIASLAHQGKTSDKVEQETHLAINRLIEGSSLDDQRTAASRLRDVALQNLMKCFEAIECRIENELDLDAIDAHLNLESFEAEVGCFGDLISLTSPEIKFPRKYPLAAVFEKDLYSGLEENWSRNWIQYILARTALQPIDSSLFELLKNSEDPNIKTVREHLELPLLSIEVPLTVTQLDLNAETDVLGSFSILAPRVMLANAFDVLPKEEVDCIEIEIDEQALNNNLGQQETRYQEACEKAGLSGCVPAFSRPRARRVLLEKEIAKGLAEQFGYGDLCRSEKWTYLFEIEDRLKDDDYEAPANPWSSLSSDLYLRRQIDLQILRDDLTDQWRPYICVGSILKFSEETIELREGNHFVGGSVLFGGIKLVEPFEMINLDGVDQFTFLEKQGEGRYRLFLCGDYDSYDGDKRLEDRQHLPGSETGLGILLERSDNFSVDRILPNPDLKCEGYVPVPRDTLASVILSNFAYADQRMRIDELLVRDAKHRIGLAEKIIAQRRQDFEAAISWMDDLQK